ncbi:MAG: FAD-dependent thymidylate synthase [Ignavibacteriaceae bacterium]|jgi:thymidylate synthase, flavin-dependent|nr:MAG: FAD-dependent thymidylate synthase [Chlorobiota bacterium]KXK02398.1 MAG: FAD-dependent thymidylate synthase [Chlorobi bacterium OLB4]MBV6397998.1 Flavin-dependent thymidylate synthase [Ignavibacteria bacterium]MCC6886445.1 FAD-dependent thymidylate synthase [Ignavibacteriales bacterium]MCE7952479.1 FAD-dependent thymidylate synthase [Chlorobi bacterium CHB7]MDL1886595.1 FAD-dependent thymidylate synthase [Ignavibacteria bacterium CHB1]MEB2329686.1 FAD-dependent thymidylate synthase [
MKRDVLDKGFIEIIDHIGSDLTVVNSARVSFGKRKSQYDENDRKLVKYLAKHKHWSPFRHLVVQFHIKAPEFVMRQWYKHVVGIETSSSYPTKDHAWNEISGRYVPVKDFYRPSNWRKQSDNNKQASEGSIENQIAAEEIFDECMNDILDSYNRLLELGVAKEQARLLLPLNQYTEVYWTASFQAITNFIELRDEDTAQWEIRQYSIAMKEMVTEIYPETMSIWFSK